MASAASPTGMRTLGPSGPCPPAIAWEGITPAAPPARGPRASRRLGLSGLIGFPPTVILDCCCRRPPKGGTPTPAAFAPILSRRAAGRLPKGLGGLHQVGARV